MGFQIFLNKSTPKHQKVILVMANEISTDKRQREKEDVGWGQNKRIESLLASQMCE